MNALQCLTGKVDNNNNTLADESDYKKPGAPGLKIGFTMRDFIGETDAYAPIKVLPFLPHAGKRGARPGD